MAASSNNRKPHQQEGLQNSHQGPPRVPQDYWNPITQEGTPPAPAQRPPPYPDSLDMAMTSSPKPTPTQPTVNNSRIQNNHLAFGGPGSYLDPKPTQQDPSLNNQATQLAKAAYLQNKQRFQGGNKIF